MNTCAFEPCDRPSTPKFDLCKYHRVQQRQGKELSMPKGRGGHNAKHIGLTCEYEFCDLPATTAYKCQAHYWQFMRYGKMKPIGTKWERTAAKNGGYSETMTCFKCHQTKNWRKFVLGLENVTQSMCRDCHRAYLSVLAVGPVVDHHSARNDPAANKQALLDLLDSVTESNDIGREAV